MNRDDEVRQALETIRKHSVPRGDGFDVGSAGTAQDTGKANMSALLNPQALMQTLNLTQIQAENIRSLIVGGGTAGIYKILNKHLGSELAGMIAGLASGYVAKRIVKD